MAGKRKYDLLTGIDACYRYSLQHTDFTPDEDLYQDIAADYIEKYHNGVDHGKILSSLLHRYKSIYNKQQKNIETIPVECVQLISDYIDTCIMLRDLKTDIYHVLNTLTKRESEILILYYCDLLTLKEIATEYGVTENCIRVIRNKAICKLRHPIRAKQLRHYYYLI
jgi:RNA polymerase sigma factor (sigma-70 family)